MKTIYSSSETVFKTYVSTPKDLRVVTGADKTIVLDHTVYRDEHMSVDTVGSRTEYTK